MALTQAQIYELQGHFDARSRLQKVAHAIKCYTNDASFFYSCVDGWGKKQYVNIPIEPEDIMPIIETYINNIEQDIIKLTTPPELEVRIENEADLIPSIDDYKRRYPDTYTSLQTIHEKLKSTFYDRMEEAEKYEGADYHIAVCSDWQDKIYVFELLYQTDNYIHFKFKEIFKL